MHNEGNEPIRILQVNTRDYGGGAEGSAWNLFKGYMERGLDSWLAVGEKYSQDPNVFLIPNDAKRNIWTRNWRIVQARSGRGSNGTKAHLIRKLAAIGEPRRLLDLRLGLEDFHYPGSWHLLGLTPRRPTLIHCHNLHGNYFDLSSLPWLTKQVPVILNLRDAWLLSGHCAHSLGCERWKFGCGRCPDLTIYPAISRDATAINWRRKRGIYSKSLLHISTPSQWLMNEVRHSMIQGLSYRVIPNGVDLRIFHPANRAEARSKLDLPRDCKIVLFVANGGRASPWRDYKLMENALQEVAYRNQDTRIIFVCVGKSEPNELVGRIEIRPVAFERNPNRLAEYYQAADVYIHAAKAEAFGKTVTEALACGIPVVATAVGGIPEQISSGVTGFLIEPTDTTSFAARIEQVLLDAELRMSLGYNAAKSAKARFDVNIQISTFLEWYQEILTPE